MNNALTTASSTSITMGNAIGGSPYCTSHGYNSCNCFANNLYGIKISCSVCGQYFYGGQHICSGVGSSTQPFTTWTSGGTTFTLGGTTFKDVKEITTDNELRYEWNGGSFNMILPQKFSDCFLKVGYTWSPLYPLIFSALENDSKEISFHIVVGITDKIFEGDKVILKSVTTTKIEDNLTLLQLTQRTKEFFKDDKTNSSVL